MKGTRFPLHPGKILTRSLQLGLSATAYLAKTRTTKATKHLYEGGKGCKGIKNILREGQENYYHSKREKRPNASHLQKVERNIRRSHYKVILNTSVAYGNSETKRKRRKEDRKYINNLADYYGSVIRNIAAYEFQFQPPMETYTDKGEVKWVYPGNSRIPEFAPQHTAPELDFIDMIRPHGLEMIRQCLKYSVPMRDARTFLNVLVKRLTPFLEQVYTEQKKIEFGFVRGSTRVLREVTEEIHAKYGGMNGRPLSVTEDVSLTLKSKSFSNSSSKVIHVLSRDAILEGAFDTNSKFPVLDAFFSTLAEGCDITISSDWKERVKELRKLITKKVLSRNDAKYILKDILEHSRLLGASFHDFVSNAEFTTRPFSLSSVFRYGDEMATERSEFLFVCEVPIADGRGRVDIILFRRKKLHRTDDSLIEYIWEPCMLIEVKTRCFYNLDLYATFTKSKDRSRRVMEHVKDLRRSEVGEWQKIIDATPIEYERGQLEAYERGIIMSYSKFARRDLNPPIGLMKGVLVVDLKENWEDLRDNIKELILEAYHKSEGATLSKREHFHFDSDIKDLRMALVVFSDAEERESTPIKKVDYSNLLQYSKKREDNREFILYLTISGKGSPAQSAAEIAARWHGLELIYKRVKGTHRDILWFDLSGALATSKTRKRIFRTTLLPASIRRFLRRRIKFIDLSESVSLYLQGGTTLSLIRSKIQVLLQGARRPVIVVTGSDRKRSSTVIDRTPLVDRFIAQFLKDVPAHSTLLWFDRPVPTTQTSQRYDTRSIAPFYSESPWVNLVDEIIYNIPMAPRRYGSYVPVEDDHRWLVTETNDDFAVTPILIPPLHKWGERFRSDSSRNQNINRQNTFYLRSSSYSNQRQAMEREYDEDDENALLELIPHLQRFYEEDSGNSKEIPRGSIKREILSTAPALPRPFLSRVNFTPYQYLTETERDGRVTRIEPLAMINHRREYRESRLYGTPRKVTTHPPHIGLLRFNTQDIASVVSMELRGIRSVLKIIKKRHSETKEWNGLLESLSKLVDNHNKSTDAMMALRQVRTLLECHPLSQGLWCQLRNLRSMIPRDLIPEQELILKRLIAQHPDLLSVIGSQFFLILLTSFYEAEVLKPQYAISEKLWQYFVPWQLMVLGFEPVYPPQHQTGESVLQRLLLIDRLAKRARALQDLYKNTELHQLRFGKAILVNNEKGLPSLLLSFQTRSESHEMNIIFIRIPQRIEGNLTEILRNLCRERSFWGESDLTRLGTLSDLVHLKDGVDIMIAMQGGVQGLWVMDSETSIWKSIGSFTYYSRPREQVTLLMSVTLQEERELVDVPTQSIGTQEPYLKSMIEISLGTVSAVFRKCNTVKCQVSLDTREKMFRIAFLRPKTDEEVAHLLIQRTVDVLEILRRPDFQCQQVIVDRHEMIWNRFRDIDYQGDTKVLRPWVERREPFKIVELELPALADQFVQMERCAGLKLSVLHNRQTCPLCAVPPVELKQRIQDHGESATEYLQLIEGSLSQPDDVLSESMYGHGLCWRVGLEAKEELPGKVRDLESIALSSFALATLLKTGAMVYCERNQWVLHEFDLPQASNLPREFRESIILVEAYRDIVPRALRNLKVPGSYLLEREERWIVTPSFLDRDAVIWSAQSDTTGETYRGTSFSVQIASGLSLENATEIFIKSVAKTLPVGSIIRNLDTLLEHIKDSLRVRGHIPAQLYVIELEGKRNCVNFNVERKGSGYYDYGSVKVAESMSIDEVYKRLLQSVGQEIGQSEYEIESPDEVRWKLEEVLQKIALMNGWKPLVEPKVERKIDIMTASLEHGEIITRMQDCRATGRLDLENVVREIDELLSKIRVAVPEDRSLVGVFIDLLIMKVDLLVSGELDGTVDPSMVLSLLDEVEENSYYIEPRVLKSRSEFAKKVRWALALQESLRKKR